MNNTAYWILGGVVTIVMAVLVAWGISLGGTPNPPAQDPQSPSYTGPVSVNVPVTPGSEPAGNTSTLLTQSGTIITTHNFLDDAETTADKGNPGNYYIGYAVDSTSPEAPSHPYIINYIKRTDLFSITLLQEPIGEVRRQAEQYLMQRLGITQTEMCQLRYMVSVPVRVSQIFAGESLGFSFCPGATEL